MVRLLRRFAPRNDNLNKNNLLLMQPIQEINYAENPFRKPNEGS